MAAHTFIALGYCNVSASRLRALLDKRPDGGGVELALTPCLVNEAYGYAEGKRVAQEMAVGAAQGSGASLCIGIVCVRFEPQSHLFRPAPLDIAMRAEHGVVRDKEVLLNPVSCKRASRGLHLHETVYAREANDTLIEYLRVWWRSMLLQHF